MNLPGDFNKGDPDITCPAVGSSHRPDRCHASCYENESSPRNTTSVPKNQNQISLTYHQQVEFISLIVFIMPHFASQLHKNSFGKSVQNSMVTTDLCCSLLCL